MFPLPLDFDGDAPAHIREKDDVLHSLYTQLVVSSSHGTELEAIHRQYEEFRFDIGVAGDEAAGKSSLIACLLGEEWIAYSKVSSNVPVHYFAARDNGIHVAVLVLKTKDEIAKWIHALVGELSSGGFNNDTFPDFTREINMICSWTGFTVCELKEMTPDAAYRIAGEIPWVRENNLRVRLAALSASRLSQLISEHLSGPCNPSLIADHIEVYGPAPTLKKGMSIIELHDLQYYNMPSSIALDQLLLLSPSLRSTHSGYIGSELHMSRAQKADGPGNTCIVNTKKFDIQWMRWLQEFENPVDDTICRIQSHLGRDSTLDESHIESIGGQDILTSLCANHRASLIRENLNSLCARYSAPSLPYFAICSLRYDTELSPFAAGSSGISQLRDHIRSCYYKRREEMLDELLARVREMA